MAQTKDGNESRTATKKRPNEESSPDKERTITGARAVINGLEEQGAEVVFGIIGGAIMPIYDELGKSDKIRHVTTTHEQGAIHAADAYARVTGKPGVVFATSGPGASNLMTGVANAYMDSSPVISFTGQVATPLIGQDSFQEVDVRGMSDPITKHNYLVMEPKEVPKTIRKSFHLAQSGRPGPIVVDLPKDVQMGEFTREEDSQDEKEFKGYEVNPDVNGQEVEDLADSLLAAERPVVLIGGGIAQAGAESELMKVVEELELPVASSLMGLGCVNSRDPHLIGMVGMHGSGPANKAIAKSDFLLAVGTRLDDRITGNVEEFAPRAEIAHVDIDPAEMGKIIQPDFPVVGDAKKVLSSLNDLVEGKGQIDKEWWGQIRSWFDKYSMDSKGGESVLKPQEVVRALSELTDNDETIVTTGVGQHQMWAAQHYEFTYPNQLITSGGLGTMGFGFPAGIGAQIAAPDRPVVTVTGDGSFQMNIQELTTAVRERLPITVVILRNGSLGMVRQWQQLFFDNRLVETLIDEGTPSLAKVTEAYGGKGISVAEEEGLRPAMQEALNYDRGPSVVECFVAEEENVFPMVPAGAANENFILGEGDA
ncbi:biosynthetic-type acetolactate synthase large subunit [Candidatus Bipolaricaulota bacterium]|nr:biosynthetic-type acetolactate synthase large subunit [Candidatus Bipolaricaulota bacterium]